MGRVYNFSAGPAVLPEEVLKEAADEMLDYKGTGMSVMEMSHRSKAYDEIIKDAEKDLRELMNIPDNYKVIFLQGGASLVFAEVPMNLMKNGKAAYIITGQWAKKAAAEAEKFGEVVVRIELDGRMLNNVRNINVRPYDYNYNEFRDGFDNEGLDFDSETMQMPQRMQIMKYAQNGELTSPYNTEEVEAEDSLTLNGDDQIVDASNYITRIDIFLPSHLSESQLGLWDIFLRRYLDDYPDWSEKMHFYNDVNAFDYQRDDKELPAKSLYGLYKQQYAQSLAENIVLTERDIRKMINETMRRIMKRL